MDFRPVLVHGVQTDLPLDDGGPVVGQLELVEGDEALGLPLAARHGALTVDEGVRGRLGIRRASHHPLGAVRRGNEELM